MKRRRGVVDSFVLDIIPLLNAVLISLFIICKQGQGLQYNQKSEYTSALHSEKK
jgi:hypothetical protein